MTFANYTSTARVRNVIAAARAESARLQLEYIGTEHLRLGIIEQEKGIAAQTFAKAGVTAHVAKARILRILGA